MALKIAIKTMISIMNLCRFDKNNWTFRGYDGIVLCYKEVQHYATYKNKTETDNQKQRNDRITGNDLGDAVVLLYAEGGEV